MFENDTNTVGNTEPANAQSAAIQNQRAKDDLLALKANIIKSLKECGPVVKKLDIRLKIIPQIAEFISKDGLAVLEYGDKSKFIDECIQEAGAADSTLYHYFAVADFAAKRSYKVTDKTLPGMKALCMTDEAEWDQIWQEAQHKERTDFPVPKTVNAVIKQYREAKNGVAEKKVSSIKATKAKSMINAAYEAAKVLRKLADDDLFGLRNLTANSLDQMVRQLEDYIGSDEFKQLSQ